MPNKAIVISRIRNSTYIQVSIASVRQRNGWKVTWIIAFVSMALNSSLGTPANAAPTSREQAIEWTIETARHYADPFNDVDVDVVFSDTHQSWRVPAFWAGGDRWNVRFTPPTPGTYSYHLESTDKSNSDLNGHFGTLKTTAYTGQNPVYAHGMMRVSKTRRYFEQADGTPFFWLGDTWWTGLSSRMTWASFQQLARDRQSKGFTVVQICAGLVPSYEEIAPSDPGFCNEGGCAWEPSFARINPHYFDVADERIRYLLAHGLVPAIVGGWRGVLAQMGISKMKQHWRYLIARYGAYPVFWIAGGEVYDPPPSQRRADFASQAKAMDLLSAGWTEIVRYIRLTDPYHHPLSVHEVDPPFDSAIQDETLTDFDLFQAGHRGWPSIATEIALLNKHYARTKLIKPLVVGEIGYEGLFATHREDFQRAAFWLSVLNGAAGHTYGAVGTWESYGVDKPFHRMKWSFLTSTEGMNLPGSYQVGMAAKLLRKYQWWTFRPHPEWVTPHGTTLLEPTEQLTGFDIDLIAALQRNSPPPEGELPLGEWHNVHGSWRAPYAAGDAGTVRMIYLPNFGFKEYPTPVINQLEPGVRYHAYYWEPSLGITFDLGIIERSAANGVGHIDVRRVSRQLYDAQGHFRGELTGPIWGDFPAHQHVIGDTYQPEKPPGAGDWVLVLEAVHS